MPKRRGIRRSWYRRNTWLVWLIVGAAVGSGVVLLRSGETAPTSEQAASGPTVGTDLHSFVVDPSDPEKLYIGSHQGVSVSTDGGETWQVEDTLNGADAMGWAFTKDAILVGGHPGISISTDGGETFEQHNGDLPSTDVHALGAGRRVVYVASPGAGVLASTDQGASWDVRTTKYGQQFMGRILVDPTDDEHLVAPDMAQGAVESEDGGRTWSPLGGAPGTMWVSWSSEDTKHIIATAQGAAVETTDGGAQWKPLDIPDGVSIVEVSPHDPDVLYGVSLEAPRAEVAISEDAGRTWSTLTK